MLVFLSFNWFETKCHWSQSDLRYKPDIISTLFSNDIRLAHYWMIIESPHFFHQISTETAYLKGSIATSLFYSLFLYYTLVPIMKTVLILLSCIFPYIECKQPSLEGWLIIILLFFTFTIDMIISALMDDHYSCLLHDLKWNTTNECYKDDWLFVSFSSSSKYSVKPT